MKKPIIHLNNNGLSITELLIALGLSCLVGLGVFEVLQQNDSMQKMFNQKMDDRIEANLGDKLILKDLRAAGPSLNNLKVSDDNNLNFFDFDADRSSPFYRSQSVKSRTMTLKMGEKTTMYFLAFDDLRGKGLFADAVTFFEVGAPPANIYSPAPLTYRGLNYNNYLTATDAKGVPMNNPALISPANLNKLVLVDSSSYMPTSPARPAVFIGSVVNSGGLYDVAKVATTSIPKDSRNRQIWDYLITTPIGTTLDATSFVHYMFNLPPVGANGASVRIKPIRLYKYELDCSVPSSCVLFRHDVLHGSSTQKFPLMRGFNCIKFTREDIAESVFVVGTSKDLCKKML